MRATTRRRLMGWFMGWFPFERFLVGDHTKGWGIGPPMTDVWRPVTDSRLRPFQTGSPNAQGPPVVPIIILVQRSRPIR
jgi:hypothetical protein